MRTSRWGWLAAPVGSAAVALLLLWPVELPPGSSLWHAAGGSAHVLLFAGLAWAWGRRLPAHLRGWALWGMLAVFSAGMEWLQPRTGRSAEWTDWFFGAAAAAVICGTWSRRRPVWRRAGLLVLGLFPVAWAATMVYMEMRAFPVLADPRSVWAERGWMENFVRIASVRDKGLKVEAAPAAGGAGAAYPGIFRSPVCSDWRGAESLRATLFWPDTNTVFFAFRVDDRVGPAPYADRFQREFSVTQGWNDLRIPVEDLRWSSGGRPMDLSSIRNWGVFLVSDSPFDYFSLGPVSLNLFQERP